MAIKVLDAGPLTTVQDLGRAGYQKDGVSIGGAMDHQAFRIANLLVGNRENEAGLEVTLLGPTLHFMEDALIAITGANLSPTLDGIDVPMWKPFFIKMGSVLKFGPCVSGCRSYLAVAGGLDVPDVLGSKSTNLQAGFGGFKGRAMNTEDFIKIGKSDFYSKTGRSWSVSLNALPEYKTDVVLHIVEGPEFDLFLAEDMFTARYAVSPESNRMGYRLKGPALNTMFDSDMLSSPVSMGTIQVPPDGQPVILMADCQTTGGYPRIGHVIRADLPMLAQVKPGDTVRFQKVSLGEAHKRLLNMEKNIRMIKRAIKMRCLNGVD